MRAVSELPAGYEVSATIDLSKDKKLMILLSVVGTCAFVLFGILFIYSGLLLNHQFPSTGTFRITFPVLLLVIVGLSAGIFVIAVLHEAVHGIFFWLFTGKRPVFGFKGLYAYAAAPEWYIPRTQFLVIGLAPLVLMTLLGLLLLPLVSFPVALALIVGLTMNAAGAVGDLYVVCWLLTKGSSLLVCDTGSSMIMYSSAKVL